MYVYKNVVLHKPGKQIRTGFGAEKVADVHRYPTRCMIVKVQQWVSRMYKDVPRAC